MSLSAGVDAFSWLACCLLLVDAMVDWLMFLVLMVRGQIKGDKPSKPIGPI